MRRIRTKQTEENNNTIPEEITERTEEAEEINKNNTEQQRNNCELNYNENKITNKHFYNFTIGVCNFILKTFLLLLKASGIYLLWICLHYFSAHLYIKFCVPDTIIGFLMSPFMIATPHCQGLRWIVYNAAGIINNMWILIGAWIYSLIWIFNKDPNVQSTHL